MNKEKESEPKENLQFMCTMESAQLGAYAKLIKEVICKLERIDTAKYKAAAISARAEHFLMGETPTKRALSDEKK